MSEFVEERAGAKVLEARRTHFITGVKNGLWIVLLAGVAYYTMFRLPFRFPPRQRLWSASYAFGFNNRVAILALAGLLGGIVVFHLARARHVCELPIKFPRVLTVLSRKSLIGMLMLLSAFYAVLTFAMYSYNIHSAPKIMWETRHFFHRMWLMDVYQLNPYTDFQAEYGPILAYAPLYSYRLLKPLGASHEQAYFAAHFFLNLGGLCSAYYLLSRALMRPIARIVAFALLAIAGFAPYMGLNGVLLRYLCPFASLLLGHNILLRILARFKPTSSVLVSATAVMLLLTVNILLSPEAGLAFALAWLGYGVLIFRRDRRILPVSLIALMITALLCWMLLPSAYYGSLLSFSVGGNNLPLLPAPHLLFYLLTIFLVAPPLLAVGLRTPPGGDIPGAALCGALGMLCVIMSPGALSRCDPPHVLFYGMGASLLVLIRLANLSRAGFVVYATAYGIVFIVLMQVVNLQVFYGARPQALLSWHGLADTIRKLRYPLGTEHPDSSTLLALNRYSKLGLPFATFGDPVVETYVLSRGQLDPDYYISIVGVYTPAALERKLREIAKMEYLLVPQGFGSGASSDACGEYLKSLRRWFLYPAHLPCRAEPLDPVRDLNRFIAEHYVPFQYVGSWQVMRRINASMIQNKY